MNAPYTNLRIHFCALNLAANSIIISDKLIEATRVCAWLLFCHLPTILFSLVFIEKFHYWYWVDIFASIRITSSYCSRLRTWHATLWDFVGSDRWGPLDSLTACKSVQSLLLISTWQALYLNEWMNEWFVTCIHEDRFQSMQQQQRRRVDRPL